MADDLEAAPVSLLDLLQSEREYHSPLFQRRYVWKRKDIDRLWADIKSILDGEDELKFLGAIVLESRPKGLATAPTSYWIIDGQQRLTSLYLFLVNVATLAQAHGDDEVSDDIVRVYLLNQSQKVRNQPKLRPTLLDQFMFNSIMRGLIGVEPVLPQDYGDKTGRLLDADKHIRTIVRDYCRPEREYSPEQTRKLHSVLVGALRFVHIVLMENAQVDPNQVFDSLNTTGQSLENRDLIRNEVFKGLSERPEEAQAIYQNRWIPFEERLGERLERYFFPFTLLHDSDKTKSSVLSFLRERWVSKTALEIIEDLGTYSDSYDLATLRHPPEVLRVKLGPKTQVALGRLVRLGPPASVLPFAMRVLDESIKGSLADDKAAGCLALVESFLVRRGFVGLEPTGLHVVFKGLWAKSSGDPAKARKAIEDLGTVTFPDDITFRKSVIEDPLYRRKSILSHVLAEFEAGLQGGDAPAESVPLTADHVIPQSLTESWKAVVSGDEHQRIVHTWANLVPLSQKTNSEKSRDDWPAVREFFRTETHFRTTKRLAEQHIKWDLASVEARAHELAQWAVKRWSKETP